MQTLPDFFLPNNQLDSKNLQVIGLCPFFYRTISWIQKIEELGGLQLFSTEQSAGFKKWWDKITVTFFLPNNQLDSKNSR
jgi:hypothetical protein